MESLVTTHTLENIDSRSINDFTIHPLLLMEHAGVKGFHLFVEQTEKAYLPHHRLLFVVGGGNNGGDTLVMAREAYLLGIKHIQILLVGTHISNACNHHRSICRKIGLEMHEISFSNNTIDDKSNEMLTQADFIFDGISGTGLRGKMNESMALLVSSIKIVHDKGAYVVSVDIPSGCSDTISPTQPHIICDLSITFGLQKSATYHPMSRSSYGKVVKVNPSFPLSLLENAPKSALLATIDDVLLKKNVDSDYKNKRGHLALFAGSLTYTGAPKITALSAFHSGVGLVSLYCDEEIAPIIKGDSISLIIHPVKKGDVISKKSLIDFYDAIAVGPGWQMDREEQLLSLLKASLPMVCDADGIATWAQLIADKRIGMKEHCPLILTPHPGELVRMLEILNMPLLAQEVQGMGNPESFIESLTKIAVTFNVVLVYKSHVVWIVDGTENHSIPIVVDGSNNAMGVGGSGDALTGIIASFLARDYSLGHSALNGVLIHQRAGVMARDDLRWFDAMRLITHIGLAYKEREGKE